jgi:chromosome segregation ATPase
MENLTQYLDKSLKPLEDKVREYLNVERDIRLLDVELLSLQSMKSDFNPEQHDLEQEIKEGGNNPELNDKEQKMADLLNEYNKLRSELITMLPEKNRFIEINLGYGPSMVGYFTIDHETRQPLPEPVLRVVH